MRIGLVQLIVATAGSLGLAGAAQAGVFSSYECDITATNCTNAAVSGGNFDLISNTNATTAVAGLEYQVTPADSLTVAGLTALSASYNMTTGAFAGGAPRFTLFDDSFGSAFVYWGTPIGGGSFANPNANNTWGSTGNYADLSSSDLRVYLNGFGGSSNPNVGETWAQFVATYGAVDLSFITLDLDAGTFAGSQELLVNDFTVNQEVDSPAAVPEPATLALLSTGLLGLGALRRRRQNP